MAEVFTNVHDILFPSPPALKNIAAISIAVQLWRQEINTHRIKNTLTRLNLEQNILSSETLPRIPVTIISLVKVYVRRIGLSIQQWLNDHDKPFLFKTDILNDFIDFVGDFDGTIDYVKTARRFVLCDRIDKIIRFNVACYYCFEDVISQIWPTVSSEINSNGNSYLPIRDPVLFYWICKLKNQLYKLPRPNSISGSIENEIFLISFPAWTTKEYFWNRLSVNSRMRKIPQMPLNVAKIFSRYLVAKFNKVELDKFSNGSAYTFMSSLFERKNTYCFTYALCSNQKRKDDFQSRARYFMALWAYIKHRMSAGSIYHLMRSIARMLYTSQESVNTSVYCEWWNTIPDHVKPRLTEGISKDDFLLQREPQNVDGLNVRSSCLFNFLFAILSDASDDERDKFWSKNWRKLIDVMCTAQSALNQLMRLCFDGDENKITEFKTTCLMSALEDIKVKCSKLLHNLRFEELNEFLSFCYLDEQARKTIRANLLAEEFRLDLHNIFKLSPQLKDFINDAYDDVNLATDFKTRLLFSPSTLRILKQLITDRFMITQSNFHRVISAIDIIAPSEQIARDYKKIHIFPIFEQKLRDGSSLVFADGEFLNFLRDCLGGDDEMARFKETLAIDELVQNMIRNATTIYGGLKYNSFLVQLLEWYFPSPQALEEFKSMYADDYEFVQLTGINE